MARRRFPSDRRPWFRVLADILHDEKLNSDDCSADVAWFYLRLLAMLQQTGSRNGQITLDRRGLAFCTCRAQHRHALSIARACAELGLCTLSTRGAHAVIEVPNWAKLQGFAPTSDGPRGEERREEKRGRPAPASPAPSRPVKRKPKTPCPNELDDAQRHQVRAWRDAKHPGLDDRELGAQWALFADHYIGEGKVQADWVRTFYKWLTGPYYKRLTPSAPVRQVALVEREPAPAAADPAELERVLEASREARKAWHRPFAAAAGGR